MDDEVETLVAMFESDELTFLLFFDMPSPHGNKSSLGQMAEELQPKARKPKDGSSKPVSGATQAFVDVLSFLAEEMTEFCKMSERHDRQ